VAYLLDTNVVSELRKVRRDPNVAAWYERAAGADAYLSVLVIGELRQGVERLRVRDPVQAGTLGHWLDVLTIGYGDRILPVTKDVAQEWGRLNALPQPLPVVDGLIGATAKVHRLTVATRHVDHFARAGVAVVNPFADTTG